VCKVRFNRGGKLYAPYGYVNAVHCDPIEKKPFFHAHPGTRALSFGNARLRPALRILPELVSSQALRDARSTLDFQAAAPRELVNLALLHGAASLVSTYNEPLITAEWAVAVFREAKAAGLATGFVSNGNGTPEVLEYIRPWVDLYKVDLKSFDDRATTSWGRPPRAGSRLHRPHPQAGLLVGSRYPGGSRLQRLGCRVAAIAAFLAGISTDIRVARHRVPPGLQDAGTRDTPA